MLLYKWQSAQSPPAQRSPSPTSSGGPHSKNWVDTELLTIIITSLGFYDCSVYINLSVFVHASLSWKHFYLPASSNAPPVQDHPGHSQCLLFAGAEAGTGFQQCFKMMWPLPRWFARAPGEKQTSPTSAWKWAHHK